MATRLWRLFVKKLQQQLVAAWLVIAFAGGGMVGLSPDLHQWWEHGGQGPAHAHHGPGAAHTHEAGVPHHHVSGTHEHGHAHLHPHAHAPSHRHPAAPPDSEDPPADHEHDSLAQLLASGLVDLTIAVDFDPAGATRIVARIRLPHELPQVRYIDRLRAGRGPPFPVG